MPTIPQAERTVERKALIAPTGQRQVNDPDVFGGNVAKGIGDVGNVITGIQLEELASQNQARALEIDNQFREALGALQYNNESGYYNKRGRDAVEGYDQFQQSTEELYSGFIGQAENSSHQLMLAKAMRNRVNQVKSGAQRYHLQELQTWKDNAAKESIKNDITEAVTNYLDTDYVGLMRTSGESKIRELGRSLGLESDQINANIKDFNSDVSVGIVERMIPEDVRGARAQYNEYVKSREITGLAQTALLRKLKIAEKGDLATDRAHYSEIVNMAMRDPEEFIQLDLNQYDLSDQDFKSFEKDQRTAQFKKDKHDEKYSGIKRAMGLATSQLKSAGILSGKTSKKKRERLAEFEGALQQGIIRFTSENGRAPDEAEQRTMIRNLLHEGEVPGTGWFFDDEAFIFEDETTVIQLKDIDEDMQNHIVNKLTTILGRKPTTEEIEDKYTQFVRSKAQGKK